MGLGVCSALRPKSFPVRVPAHGNVERTPWKDAVTVAEALPCPSNVPIPIPLVFMYLSIAHAPTFLLLEVRVQHPRVRLQVCAQSIRH